MTKNAVFFVFLSKNTHKTHENVKVAVINDNNNFAPSLFRSLCKFDGHTSVQNNHLRFSHNDLKKDGAQLLLSNYTTKDSGHIIYVRIRHSFAHVWTILNKMASFDVIAHVRTILNKMASFGVNIYRPSASEHGQNITNITTI